MEIAEITATRLKQALNAFQQTQPPPVELLTLDILRLSGGQSEAERQIHLRTWLYETIRSHLQRFRVTEGRITAEEMWQTRQQITAGIAADFTYRNPELEAWSALYYRYCIPISISNNDLARAAAIVTRQFSRRLQSGLELLAGECRRQELEAKTHFRAQNWRQHLPPPDYTELFGIQAHLKQLTDLLQQEDGPRMVSIEGLGGIGKTTLARAFAVHFSQTSKLEGVVWISARHEWLTGQGELQPLPDPVRSLADIITRLAEQLGETKLAGLGVEEKVDRLQPVLAAAPHLIVIDNLETLNDVEMLLPALTPLRNVTRFLLTSRHSLSRYAFVHRLPVPPLSLADSRALIESELTRRGRHFQLDTATMGQLHSIIGGVPLALKLTAAQLAHLPLKEVMDGLQQASQQSSERLFTYIYRHTWQLLDAPAKALLLSLLSISPDGEAVNWLRLMSDLPEDDFVTALAQLVEYSLLEVSGSPAVPTYRLHRLTTTFLQTEILLNWSA